MERPRILLVPAVTELEWRVRPQLEEWAEVAAYDAPGVGDEPPVDTPAPEAVVARGLAELDRRSWERCVVVGDEFGALNAARLAAARPQAVQGLALGHPCLSLTSEGPRASLRGEVLAAFTQIRDVDYRAYARALTQVTRDAYDDDLADEYIRRVPSELDEAYGAIPEADLSELLRDMTTPLLLVEHAECALWTEEAFEDVAAAFPQAASASVTVKPSASPEFARLLREFCRQVATG